MALFDNLLQSNGVGIQESAIGLGSNDPDREKNLEDGFRRLTKTQNERDLRPLELSRNTKRARALDDSTAPC